MTAVLTNLFDGIAYGMLLFVLACGLAVTLGLMNFVNLAHGAFAMAGGYVTVLLMDRAGWPFLACLPMAFIVAAAIGLLLERTLYRHMYRRAHLDQVLFSIGLVFMAVAITDYLLGSSQRNIRLPDWLQGRREILGVNVGIYRSFLIVLCGAIPVGLVFAATFAVGSGLAGLGGALGVELLGLDPYFPLKFMIYFLIVVTVGGTSGIIGPFLASMLLGIADVAGKYYLSTALGGFVIYVVLIVVLVLRPHGLFARVR